MIRKISNSKDPSGKDKNVVYDLVYQPNRPDQRTVDYFQSRPRTAGSERGNGHRIGQKSELNY